MPSENLGDAYALRGRMNVALQHCFRPVRLLAVHIGAGKHPVTWLSVRCLPAPSSQSIKQGASHRYRLQGSLSLHTTLMLTDYCSAEQNLTGREINVRPLQAQSFGDP